MVVLSVRSGARLNALEEDNGSKLKAFGMSALEGELSRKWELGPLRGEKRDIESPRVDG